MKRFYLASLSEVIIEAKPHSLLSTVCAVGVWLRNARGHGLILDMLGGMDPRLVICEHCCKHNMTGDFNLWHRPVGEM